MDGIFNVQLPVTLDKFLDHKETKNLFMLNLESQNEVQLREIFNLHINPVVESFFTVYETYDSFFNTLGKVNPIRFKKDTVIPYFRETGCTWVGYYFLDIKFNGIKMQVRNPWWHGHHFSPIIREGDVILLPSILEHQLISMVDEDQVIIKYQIL